MKKLLQSLLITACLGWASNACAAVTIVGSCTVKNSTDHDTVQTDDIDTTGADFFGIVVGSNNGSAAPTPVDNKGNTLTGLTAYSPATDVRLQGFYIKNPGSVGTGHHWSISLSSSFPGIGVCAFHGVELTTPFDSETGDTNDSTIVAFKPGSRTAGQDGSLYIAGVSIEQASGGGASADSGYTTAYATENAGASWAIGIAYFIQTTAAPKDPQWDAAAQVFLHTAGNHMVFKPAGASTALPSNLMTMGVGD